jgi:hypothetical protein
MAHRLKAMGPAWGMVESPENKALDLAQPAVSVVYPAPESKPPARETRAPQTRFANPESLRYIWQFTHFSSPQIFS